MLTFTHVDYYMSSVINEINLQWYKHLGTKSNFEFQFACYVHFTFANNSN